MKMPHTPATIKTHLAKRMVYSLSRELYGGRCRFGCCWLPAITATVCRRAKALHGLLPNTPGRFRRAVARLRAGFPANSHGIWDDYELQCRWRHLNSALLV